jgi:hypothetical protein
MSKVELDKIIPVKPPIVNNAMNPITHQIEAKLVIFVPYRVLNHLKILIPVGMAIIIVAAVK